MSKQEQILQSATQLFLELGFGAVSMDLMAKKAQVSKATIYAYFTSKNELFLASLSYNRQQQKIIYPKLPQSPSKNKNICLGTLRGYLNVSFDYFVNEIECSFTRLLIAELPHFPELFTLFYKDHETHITSNLGIYLKQYYEMHNPQKIHQSYLIACQIIDILRGQTLWVKLTKNPKREQFIANKTKTIDDIMPTVSLLLDI